MGLRHGAGSEQDLVGNDERYDHLRPFNRKTPAANGWRQQFDDTRGGMRFRPPHCEGDYRSSDGHVVGCGPPRLVRGLERFLKLFRSPYPTRSRRQPNVRVNEWSEGMQP